MKQQKDKYKDNESNAWALIYGQCSPELKNKLKGMSRYDNVKADKDVVKLLTMIRGYCCQFDTLNNKYMSICKITNEPPPLQCSASLVFFLGHSCARWPLWPHL